MKKIALNKETVRKLTESELKDAQGGIVFACKMQITETATEITCGGKTCKYC